MAKSFKLAKEAIRTLIPSLGHALATDRITVDGCSVDYMVRSAPRREGDSGWIFYGGGETQAYLDDPGNTSVFDVNTIANYDPGIIEFLTYPAGTLVERNSAGELRVISGHIRPDVVLMPPAGPGMTALSKDWQVSLTSSMLRRTEDGSLVLWQPGYTIWVNVFQSTSANLAERIQAMAGNRSPDSRDYVRVDAPSLTKCRYWLTETDATGARQESATILGFTARSTLSAALYFDRPDDRAHVDAFWTTLAARGEGD